MEKSTSKTIAPYGWWESPITTDLLVQKNVSLDEVLVPPNSESSSEILWIEGRPSEGSRGALMYSSSLSAAHAVDLSSAKYNVRTGVHEYGGGAAAALPDGSVVFSDYNPSAFNVMRTRPGGDAHVISPENKLHRFADFGAHPTDSNLVLAILEDHTKDKPTTVVNSLVLLDMSTSPATVHTLIKGNVAEHHSTAPDTPRGRGFYTFGRFSPNGKYISWVSWNHPSMPFWDTELWVAHIDLSDTSAPKLVSPTKISVATGTSTKKQVLQAPVWAIPSNPKDDTSQLFFSCDATGYLNLYSVVVASSSTGLRVTAPKSVLPEPVQNDFLAPCWFLNSSDYVPLSHDMLVVSYTEGAKGHLGLINLRKPRLIPIMSPFVSCTQLRRLTSTSFVLLGSRADEPTALVKVDLRGLIASNYTLQSANITVIKRSSTLISDGTLDQAWISIGKEIEFPTTLPNGSAATAHAIIFPPTNPNFAAPAATAPPCKFVVHGGPTSSSKPSFDIKTLFWTSRGFMVCAVNFGGSTGYGREYMERLSGEWGVTDVNDCVAAATFLGSKASLDPRPFSSLSKAEQDKVRSSIRTDAEDHSAISEESLPGGGCRVTVRNTASSWSWTDVVAGTASLGLAYVGARYLPDVLAHIARLLPGLADSAPWSQAGNTAAQCSAVVLGLLPWLYNKVMRVESESAAILPGLGIQLSTQRGFCLGSKRIKTGKKQRLVPHDKVLDVYVAEGYKYFSVVDYLALTISESLSASTGTDPEKVDARKGAKIERLFPNLLPRLSVVERVYAILYPHLASGMVSSSAGLRGANGRVGAGALADAHAMLMSGRSSGGYTTLAALCFYPHVFAGGMSECGPTALALLAAESHEYESQYAFQLIGGTPESIPDVYRARSPIYFAAQIRAPLLILQGSEDLMVPRNQSDKFVEELRKGGARPDIDYRYKVYSGEAHTFRRSENIKDAIEQELDWYRTRCLCRAK